ncbi:MAG TPA: aminotransferase class V-fold PLP-dependent enzyme [Candidatus Saccharimonadales bacterium]|nr:aminotransferase class V-fold PLP-dependent enzyme [Candidatus Saccharimonadales bacterium]
MDTELLDEVVAAPAIATRQGQRPYINFDNAASTPPLKSVMQAINDYLPWYSSVHRGNGLKSRLSTELYEEARQIIGEFVGADPDEHVVIFGKNTTEAINKLSYRLSLSKKDVVLISHLEHHSNDLPWRARATVKRIGLTTDGGVDKKDYIALLRKHAGQVKLVAISGASNVTGHIPDIHWFARKAHEAGAQILVDAAQLAAHRAIDMKRLSDPEHLDYVAISGHKMYAPFGSGALIGRRDRFARGEPEYRGGGTVNFVTPKLVDWAPPPNSDEAGSPNVAGAIAMAQAARLLQAMRLDNIAQHESELTAYALTQFSTVQGLQIFGDSRPDNTWHRSGVIPFTLQDKSPHLVSAILGYEWGIGVRSGCFCAHPYVMSLLGIDKRGQQRIRYNLLHRRRDAVPGMVRVSFGLYNTHEEIDQLIKALKAITYGEYGNYDVDSVTGFYTPVGVTEDFSRYFKIYDGAQHF